MRSQRAKIVWPGQGAWTLAPGQRLRIGRREGHEIVLDDSSVSRDHAELRWDADEDRPYVQDLGSSNGVRVDDFSVQGRSYLPCEGTRLEIGEVFLSVQLAYPVATDLPAATEGVAVEASEVGDDTPSRGLQVEDDELDLQEEEGSDRRQATGEERELIACLALAVKAQRQYPDDHPASQERSADLLTKLNGYLLANSTGALVTLREDQVEINGRRIRGTGLGRARITDFMALLQGTGIAGLALRGRFEPASLRALLTLFIPTGASTPEERHAALEVQTGAIEPPASVRVLCPRQVRELTYRSDDAHLTEEELALFYYARLLASVEASHLAVGHGRSPDFHVRQVRTSLNKTIEFLREGVFEQRLLALTATPYPVGAELAAQATNVCALALGLGRRLGLGRGGLSNLGFAALYHKLGEASGLSQDVAGTKPNVVRGVSCALRTRGFGDAGLSRLVVAHEHLRKTERYPRAPGLPTPHPFSLIVGVVSAFDRLCHGDDPQSPADALSALEADPRRFDATVVEVLRELLGALPRGTFLRLADARVVVSLDGGRHGRPIGRVVLRASGESDPRGTLVPLSVADIEGGEPISPGHVDPAWWGALLR